MPDYEQIKAEAQIEVHKGVHFYELRYKNPGESEFSLYVGMIDYAAIRKLAAEISATVHSKPKEDIQIQGSNVRQRDKPYDPFGFDDD